MPNPDVEGQSWPPPPTGRVPPPVVVPTRLPRGLKIGMAAAALAMLFTLWQVVRLTPGRYPMSRSLPDMPTHMLFTPLFGGYWVVFLSLPMLAVLVLAGFGLAVGVRDWRVSRTGWHEGLWMTALGFALNLLPFVLFVGYFVQRGWMSIAVE